MGSGMAIQGYIRPWLLGRRLQLLSSTQVSRRHKGQAHAGELTFKTILTGIQSHITSIQTSFLVHPSHWVKTLVRIRLCGVCKYCPSIAITFLCYILISLAALAYFVWLMLHKRIDLPTMTCLCCMRWLVCDMNYASVRKQGFRNVP